MREIQQLRPGDTIYFAATSEDNMRYVVKDVVENFRKVIKKREQYLESPYEDDDFKDGVYKVLTTLCEITPSTSKQFNYGWKFYKTGTRRAMLIEEDTHNLEDKYTRELQSPKVDYLLLAANEGYKVKYDTFVTTDFEAFAEYLNLSDEERETFNSATVIVKQLEKYNVREIKKMLIK